MQFCNGAAWKAMGPVPGSGASTANLVFVSGATAQGNAGVATANAQCNTLAAAAGLPGIYKVWMALTTGVDDPATTFTHSTLPYKEVDGTTVAANWTNLTSGILVNGINLNQNGGVVSISTKAWTNVAANGTASVSGSSGAANCLGWTDNTAGNTGDYGTLASSTSTWTVGGSQACNLPAHRYCFQQDGGSGNCTGPAGVEGSMMYNGDNHVYQYCDGTYWRAMGPAGACAGCAPSSGMVGYWKLDDGSSGSTPTTAADSSGNGNNGTFSGSPVWTSSGKIVNALTFNANSVNVPSAASLIIPASSTVSTWFKLSSSLGIGNWWGFVGRWDGGGNDNYDLFIQNDSGSPYLAFEFTTSGGYSVEANYTFTPVLGTWYQMTGIYDSSAQTVSLYLNGALVATAGTGANTPTTAAGGVTLGYDAFIGTLDDVRVYNRALSTTEITALYNWTGPGGSGCSSPAGVESDIVYNSASNVLQYCDDSVWRQMQ